MANPDNGETTSRTTVFMSYASEDYQRADKLYNDLMAMPNIALWLDRFSLMPGVEWEREIENAISTCDVAILLISKTSENKRGYVQVEIKKVIRKLEYFPPGEILIIPAVVDSDAQLKYPELKKYQCARLYEDWGEGVNSIKRSIQLASNRHSNENPNWQHSEDGRGVESDTNKTSKVNQEEVKKSEDSNRKYTNTVAKDADEKILRAKENGSSHTRRRVHKTYKEAASDMIGRDPGMTPADKRKLRDQAKNIDDSLRIAKQGGALADLLFSNDSHKW